jgi:hypothetical protein
MIDKESGARRSLLIAEENYKTADYEWQQRWRHGNSGRGTQQ